MEKQIEEQKDLILRKYIPFLKNHYIVHELKKEHLLKDIDHKECFIIKDGSVLARDKSGKTTTLEKGSPIGFAEALVSRPFDLTYILKENTTVFAFKSLEIRKAYLTASSLTRGITRYTLDRIFENKKSKTYHLIDDGFLSKQQDKFPMKDYSDGDTIFMKNQIY